MTNEYSYLKDIVRFVRAGSAALPADMLNEEALLASSRGGRDHDLPPYRQPVAPVDHSGAFWQVPQRFLGHVGEASTPNSSASAMSIDLKRIVMVRQGLNMLKVDYHLGFMRNPRHVAWWQRFRQTGNQEGNLIMASYAMGLVDAVDGSIEPHSVDVPFLIRGRASTFTPHIGARNWLLLLGGGLSSELARLRDAAVASIVRHEEERFQRVSSCATIEHMPGDAVSFVDTGNQDGSIAADVFFHVPDLQKRVLVLRGARTCHIYLPVPGEDHVPPVIDQVNKRNGLLWLTRQAWPLAGGGTWHSVKGGVWEAHVTAHCDDPCKVVDPAVARRFAAHLADSLRSA